MRQTQPNAVQRRLRERYPEAEIARLPRDIELRASHRLQVPDDGAERHLLVLGVRG